ncbi:hypothetical protein GUJ93_ZPchr0006g44557 [Zizania palustris]|uniref:Uncharacterized protein n=1 Tax=Zizania palustris TaxID=103762 RepID=A0A8J5TA65_ZIZPA|nr:hypothetical protein GUJ93_ZPchr0006g44557 [Zizania palustris]
MFDGWQPFDDVSDLECAVRESNVSFKGGAHKDDLLHSEGKSYFRRPILISERSNSVVKDGAATKHWIREACCGELDLNLKGKDGIK